MILSQGDKVMVVHRRLFENDQSRIFIGEVDGHHNTIIKVTGRSWLKDKFHGDFIEKKEVRTKIMSLESSGLIIYQIPSSTVLSELEIKHEGHGKNIMMDKNGFQLDLSDTVEQFKGEI